MTVAQNIAYGLEQRRPNLFAMRIANVLPGETILATMRYQQRLAYDDGDYEFVFPMGITPKFHDPEHPGEGVGTDAPLAGPELYAAKVNR